MAPPVYVVTHFVHCYSDAATETLGVDATLSAAKVRALRRKFADMYDSGSRVYDPSRRFVQEKTWGSTCANPVFEWQDDWRYAPHAEIEIEAWVPGAERAVSIVRSNVDEVVRDKVVAAGLRSREVADLVAGYAAEVGRGCIPGDLARAFVPRADAGPRPSAAEDVRVEWVARHGSKC